MPGTTKGRISPYSFWALSTASFLTPLILGGVPDLTSWCLAVVFGSMYLVQASHPNNKLSPFLVLPGVLAVYYGLQLVPLPVWLLDSLSPKAAYWARSVAVDTAPISLNPYETTLSLLIQYCFFSALFFGGLISKRQIKGLLYVIAASAVVVSLVGWLHLLLGWTSFLGFYRSQDIALPLGYFTTFVNSNTAAGFLLIGVGTNFALILNQDKVRIRRLNFIGAYLCCSGIVMSESKSALVLLGLLCFAWVYVLYFNPKFYRIRAYKPYREDLLWFLVPMFIIGFVLYLLSPAPEGIEGWQKSLERKLEIFESSSYLKDYWIAGSGRGSFETVFPLYQATQIRGTFSHAENIVFQLWAEAGFFVALSVGLWSAMICRRLLTRLRFSMRPLHWSIAVTIVLVGLQQFVDFGLEMLGLLLPFAVLLGRLLRMTDEQRIQIPKVTLTCLGLFPFACLAMAGGFGENPISKDKFAALSECTKKDRVEALIKEMSRQVPTDYLIFEAGLAQTLRCQSRSLKTGLTLSAKAQSRAPHRGEIRLLTGELLAQNGYLTQAAIEFRAALESSPWLWNDVRNLCLNHFGSSPSLLFEAIHGDDRRHISVFGKLLAKKSYNHATDYLEQWLLHGLSSSEYRQRKALICVPSQDLACLRELSAKRQDPNSFSHELPRAWLAFLEGQSDQARHILNKIQSKDVIGHLAHSDTILAQQLSIKLSDGPLARRFIDAQWEKSDTAHRRLQALYASSLVEQEFGNLPGAVRALEKVYSLAKQPKYLIRALKLEVSRRNFPGARLLHDRLRRDHPSHPEIDQLEQLLKVTDAPTKDSQQPSQ